MRIAVAGGTGTVGRYLVAAAERAGHDVVVLSRSTGVDVPAGTGLSEALAGVEVVVDTLNTTTTDAGTASEFFVRSTERLQQAAAAGGARRLVTLSIVGIERVPGYGYYEAKLAQEAQARRGPLPVTVLRATQFHEFPGQILRRTRKGPIALMPRARVQPVAAQTVGEELLAAATDSDAPDLMQLAGPERADLVAMARAVLRQRGQRATVIGFTVPGPAGPAMRVGALLPDPGTRLAGPTFEQWLQAETLR